MESSVFTALFMIIMIGEISIVSNINYGWAKLPLVAYNDNIYSNAKENVYVC